MLAKAAAPRPGNRRGLSNNVRREGNLENVRQENENFPSQPTPDIFCFHNLVCYDLLGLANPPARKYFKSNVTGVSFVSHYTFQFYIWFMLLWLSQLFDTNNHFSRTRIEHAPGWKGTGCVCRKCTRAEVNKDIYAADVDRYTKRIALPFFHAIFMSMWTATAFHSKIHKLSLLAYSESHGLLSLFEQMQLCACNSSTDEAATAK